MSAGATSGAGEHRQELLETIDEAGCYRLLAAVDVGRLAVVIDDHPRIVVLNYLLDDHVLLFRTRVDATIARVTGEGLALRAEFEVDSAFAPARSGWSVIASGVLVREPDGRRQAVARERVPVWAQGERDVVLRLDVAEVTGRRAGPL
jgi:uncharacterized protein